jgi:hypothetical protein
MGGVDDFYMVVFIIVKLQFTNMMLSLNTLVRVHLLSIRTNQLNQPN